MSTRKPRADGGLPVFAAELSGLRAIEASAGTGKTWTICGLYVRLLLEKKANVADILAITFTKAATAELRDRIRARLQDMLIALDEGAPPPSDPFVKGVLERIENRDEARLRVLSALCGFDEAPIQTIHGFCQRALADHAFSSRVAFECTLQPDITDVLHEVAADFWRSELATCHAAGANPQNQGLLAEWLKAKGASVESLEEWAHRYGRREGVEVRPPLPVPALAGALDAFFPAFERCRKTWQEDRAGIENLVTTSPALKRTRYQARYIPAWCVELDAWFAKTPSLASPEKLDRFSQRMLDENTGRPPPPAHAFFREVDTLLHVQAQANASIDAYWRNLRLRFADWSRQEIARRFAERNAQSYDDLLLKLQKALTSRGGGTLAAALRARYPYALIDEFQDTDSLQWGIFKAIYEDASPDRHVAFLVGDPKQAIYSFRGADVYAYLDAIANRGEPLRLLENQRSVPGLVAALNALYATSAAPFWLPMIRYEEVSASTREKAPLIEGRRKEKDRAPLRFAVCPGRPDGKPMSKDEGRAWATHAVADEIMRLLDTADQGFAWLGDDKLEAGHIAVLVNTNAQATAVRDALAERGIAAAEQSTLSVFKSAEAEQLERLLFAVTSPKDGGALRSALATDLLGLDARAILAAADDATWEDVLGEFDGYHETWKAHGLMRMLRELFRKRGVPAMLAAYRDGERRLTNLYHVCELLHLEAPHLAGMDAVVAYLASRRTEPPSALTEDIQLRLESDAHLVQIVTIHKSKGLEYPVTFVPFLWDAWSRAGEDDVALYHAPDPPYTMRLDAGSADWDAAVAASRQEELAERLRVAYVALTRAKNRCTVFTGNVRGLERSALGWLMHGIDGAGPKPDLPVKSQLDADIEQLVQRANGQIALHETGASMTPPFAFQHEHEPFTARTPARAMPSGLTLTSFSAMQALLDRQEVEPAPDHDEVEAAEGAEAPPPTAPRGGQRFSFPRGSDAGSCLHAILERIDFAGDDWIPVIREQLARAGYSSTSPAEVQEWLREVVHVKLPAGERAPFSLAQIAKDALYRELGFQLAFDGFSPRRIVSIAKAHGIEVPDLPSPRLRGYLGGYIDLVFRHDGRWYVADHKSNWLGPTGDGYAQEGLASAMAAGDYHLQYLLYVTAVHRWLKSAVQDYDYDRDFGGVLYFFLRGMHPDWQEAPGVPHGVFATRPPRALIEALDEGLGQRREKETIA